MQRFRPVFAIGLAMLASCGGGKKHADAPLADNGTPPMSTSADRAANETRVDPVFSLSGTDAEIGASNPDCSRFTPAQGPRSVLGVTPGMTTPEATSTLRCQFPKLVRGEYQPAMYHLFTDLTSEQRLANTRSGFDVTLPADGVRPRQDVIVYFAGPRNQERVFAIRSEAVYGNADGVPAETVSKTIGSKYGALVQEREPPNAISTGLAPPNPFCLTIIGTTDLTPSNGTWNHFDHPFPWDQFSTCGTRVYVRTSEQNGIVTRLQVLLIDFSLLADLHGREVVAGRQAREQEQQDSARRAQDKAQQGGAPRL